MARILGFGRSKASPRTLKERGEKAFMALRDWVSRKGRKLPSAVPMPADNNPAAPPKAAGNTPPNIQHWVQAFRAQKARPKNTWGRRLAMFVCGLVVLVGLGLFTIPAFWEHIAKLKPQYATMAQVGATTGEIFLLCLLLWQSFDKSMKVRQASLLLGGLLTVLILVHSAALWGLKDGAVRQTEREQEAETRLTRMSKEQMASATGKLKGQTQQTIATSAQKQLSAEIGNRDANIHKATFMPEWYLNGPMYLALFLGVALAHLILAYLHFNVELEDIDTDHNGVADINEPGRIVEYGGTLYVQYGGQIYTIGPADGGSTAAPSQPRRVQPLSPAPAASADQDPKA